MRPLRLGKASVSPRPRPVDTAIETAVAAPMDDGLREIPLFVRLSRASATVLTQNIALALGVKAVVIVLTLTG